MKFLKNQPQPYKIFYEYEIRIQYKIPFNPDFSIVKAIPFEPYMTLLVDQVSMLHVLVIISLNNSELSKKLIS